MGFVCTAPEHPARQAPSGTGLTVHDGKWAYCAAGASDGHVWNAVDESSFEELTRAASSAARVTARP